MIGNPFDILCIKHIGDRDYGVPLSFLKPLYEKLGWRIKDRGAGPTVVEDPSGGVGFTFDFDFLVGMCLIVLREDVENIPRLIHSDPKNLADLLKGTPFEQQEGATIHLVAHLLHNEVTRPFLSKILGSSLAQS